MSKVSSVSKTVVNLDRCEAGVIFDDTKMNIQTLARASQDAGYPSTVAGTVK